MFDGLKEKLGSFSRDVEEDVEADADEDAADADVDDAAGDTGSKTGGTDPAPEDDADDEGDRGLGERAKLFATGKTVIDEDDLQSHLDDLELALLQSDVEMGVAQEVLDGVEENLVGEARRRLSSTGNMVRDALREALYDVISVGQFDFDEHVAAADKPLVIVFTGVNGVGKTTTIAKLSQYLEKRGHSSVLANGDTYRAGANEQLREHAENLDRKVISHEQGSDPTAVLYDAVEYAEAHDVDVVLGDTAGRLHTSDDLMDQLEKIDRVIEPDMTLFVDEAVAGQDAVNRAREFDAAAEVDGTVLTKADADSQGGAAISIAHVTGKPILFLGTGQGYDHLERFDPEAIVDRLLGAD
jgi:fused signal recognition particle receptor